MKALRVRVRATGGSGPVPPPRILVLANLHLVLEGKQNWLTLIGKSNRLCNQLYVTFFSHNFWALKCLGYALYLFQHDLACIHFIH